MKASRRRDAGPLPRKTLKVQELTARQAVDLITTRALPFRLLKLTNLVSRPFFGQIAKKYNLTLNEWRTIFVLGSHPGISAIDISNHTGLQPMNISRSLASLRKSNHITEAPDPRDRRRTLVWLTHDGVKAYQEIAEAAREDTRQLFSDVPEQDLEAFSRVVDLLIEKAEVLLAAEPPAE